MSDPTDQGPQFFRSGAFTVASSAGQSGENYSVYPNSASASIASNFAFTEPVSDHARMIFSGQLNSGSDSYRRVRNTYNYRPDPGRDMKFSAAYGRLSLSAPGVGAIGRPSDFFALDPVLRDSGAEILGLGFEAKNKFLDVITVEYGMDFSRVYYGDSQNVFSPYFQLTLTPSDKWTFKTGLTSRRFSDNNSVSLPDGETLNLMEPTYITKIHGDVLVSQFKHAELSVGRSLAPETAVEVAVYQDRMEGSGTPFHDEGRNQGGLTIDACATA